ncbi:MAG: peptidylprolyl isomerase [Candidatus Riflebacteria bacterium]
MKNFKLLLIVVILVVVAVVLQKMQAPQQKTDPLIGQNLIAAGVIDQTKELQIKTAQGNIELKNTDNTWRLPGMNNMRADRNRLEEFFQRLNDAKLGEAVTVNAQKHSDLGVARLASDAPLVGDEVAVIDLKDAQGKELKSVYLGKGRAARSVDGAPGFGNDGQYCRISDSDAVYLLSSFFWIEKNQKNWLSKDLLKIAKNQVSKITWTYPAADKEVFELSRTTASEALTLGKLDADQQTRADAADSAAGFFETLNFDDFIATDSPEMHPGLENHVALWVESFDGLKLSMRISSGPVELPGLGKMNLLWLTGEYSGTDPAAKALADELASYSRKFVFALREPRVKSILIKSGNLKEARPKAKDTTASGTAALDKVAASHILIAYKGAERSKAERSEEEAKKLADELLAKIKKGEDFAKIAEENSDCPSGKSAKGSLGDFGRGVMAKEFEDTSFSLKVGEISGVVKTAFGYHIIRRDK